LLAARCILVHSELVGKEEDIPDVSLYAAEEKV
jgi:hypothetical protein